MRAAANSERLLITIPSDVKRYIEETARHFGGTLSGECVRAIREKMAREKAAAIDASE